MKYSYKDLIEYRDSLRDSRYSILSKVVNTSVAGAALVGIPGAKKLAKKRANKYAMNKMSSGAAGIIASKTGVDKDSVKSLIDGAGQMTGATNFIKGGGMSKVLSKGAKAVGSAGSSMSNSFKSTSEGIKRAARLKRIKDQRATGSGGVDTSVTT